MQIEINKQEQQLLLDAIKIRQAGIDRAINTEKEERIKEIRRELNNFYDKLAIKLTTGEIFDEKTISKQK